MRRVRVAMLGGLVLALGVTMVYSAEGEWGTVKGQVVWGGKEVPKREPIPVNKDQEHCLSRGPLLKEDYVVDKDTKGVRWVIAWLADAKQPKNAKAKIPIHPDLRQLKDKQVVLDQPCCQYEPHVFGIREGQILVAKNSAPIAHNVKIEGGADNPSLNPLIPPGQKIDVEGWKATGAAPILLGCGIHGWMNAYARVFNHPYYAVTNAKGEFTLKDAPAGEYRLIVWHPEKGWVAGREGKLITIPAGETLDLGKIELKPDDK